METRKRNYRRARTSRTGVGGKDMIKDGGIEARVMGGIDSDTASSSA